MKIVDLTLVLFHETPKAYLVGETENRDNAVWLPKSACEMGDHKGDLSGGRPYPIFEFQVEEWIALEKELI